MSFFDAMQTVLNDRKTLTENGAIAYATSGKNLLDFYFGKSLPRFRVFIHPVQDVSLWWGEKNAELCTRQKNKICQFLRSVGAQASKARSSIVNYQLSINRSNEYEKDFYTRTDDRNDNFGKCTKFHLSKQQQQYSCGTEQQRCQSSISPHGSGTSTKGRGGKG